jgi:hypothetical protein
VRDKGDFQANSTKIQEEMAAIEAQKNIDLLRNKAAADDLFHRPKNSCEEYYQATKLALDHLFRPAQRKTSHSNTMTKAKQIVQPSNRVDELAGTVFLMKLDSAYQEAKETKKDTVSNKPSDSKAPASSRPCLAEELNDEQLKIWTTVKTYFSDLRKFKDGRGSHPQPFRILVHGGPGTGKSFLIGSILQAALDVNLTVACIAPTGIAASKLPNGRTIHNFFSFPIFHDTRVYLSKPNHFKLATLQQQAKHQSLALLVIDEISYVGPEMLAQIELRLRQIMENDLPFGGIAQLYLGDFFQFPPVSPTETLYHALLNMSTEDIGQNPQTTFTSPAKQGARLFATFQKVELTQQMRAAKDPDHMSFLNQLRTSAAKGRTKTFEPLEKLKVLTRQDIEKEPDWMNAPIVVTSNEELYRINEHQSSIFAKQQNWPRIIWYQPILGLVANAIDQDQVNYLYATCHRLKGIFVHGAPGFLTENINPTLTNGTAITYHSLVLYPREDRERVLTAICSSREDIVLQYNPVYVLVNVTNSKHEHFVGITTEKDQVVIPLPQTHISKTFKSQIPSKDGKISLQTKSHGVELGYAITLHKIQGQTCKRLIVDLNFRPFKPQISFPGFYVAVSRVRKSQDLRIMPIQPNTSNLKYITSLTPPEKLTTWLTGYDNDGFWDPRRVPLTKKYDSKEETTTTSTSRKSTRKRKATEQSNYLFKQNSPKNHFHLMIGLR